jgi:hypothetical protein
MGLVWQRIESLVRPQVNDARHQRLILEGGENYRRLWDIVVTEYSNFLKSLPPLKLALAPTTVEFLCYNQALADAATFGVDLDNAEFRAWICDAISKLKPELDTQKEKRASILRSLLPSDGASENAPDETVLGLATSIFECSDCRLPVSGLHMLAHDCDRAQKPKTISAQPSEHGRETVEALLRLLRLGKETTALELDRRNDRFVCIGCPRSSFLQDGVDVLGRCVRDWRSCVSFISLICELCSTLLTLHALQVAHAIGSKKERWHESRPIWLLVGTAVTVQINGDEYPNDHAYGCLHCPVRINSTSGDIRWYGKLGAIKEHLWNE